jgi:hypothetical protein
MNFMMKADRVRYAGTFQVAASRRLGLIFETRRGVAGVKRITRGSTVTEPRPHVAQIAALADWFTAKHTGILPERRPVIDQHKLHVVSPKLWMVSGDAHRAFNLPTHPVSRAPKNLAESPRLNPPQATRNRHNQRLSASRRTLNCSTHFFEQSAVRQQ